MEAAHPLAKRPPSSLNDHSLICPTGKSLLDRVYDVSSPFCKNILIFRSQNHPYICRRSVPLEGRIAIVTSAGRNAVDAAASGTTRDGRAGLQEGLVSCQRRADERR
jgi:hypothetical protein